MNPLRYTIAPLSLVVLGGLCKNSIAAVESVYQSKEGSLGVSLGFSRSSFDEAYLGDEKIRVSELGLDESVLSTISVSAQYGITKRVAVELGISYFNSEFDPVGDDSGLADTKIGARFLLRDETDHENVLPSVGLGIRFILPGSYDAKDLPPEGLVAPGFDAFGTEASFLLGKSFVSTGTRFLVDAGYRIFTEDVPDYLFAGIKAQQQLPLDLSAAVGLDALKGLSGDDIGDPGFTLPTVQRKSLGVSATVTWETPWQQYVSLTAEQTIDGRNIGRSSGFSLSLYQAF